MRNHGLVFESALTSCVSIRLWTPTSKVFSCGAHYSFGIEWILELPFRLLALHVGILNPWSRCQVCCLYFPAFLKVLWVYQYHLMGDILGPGDPAMANGLSCNNRQFLTHLVVFPRECLPCGSSTKKLQGHFKWTPDFSKADFEWGPFAVPTSAATAKAYVLFLLSFFWH